MAERDYITGIHAVETALRTQVERIEAICVLENAKAHPGRDAIVEEARKRGLDVLFRDAAFFQKVAGGKNTQGLAAMVSSFPYGDFRALMHVWGGEGERLVLILDGVTDPHNLGAIIRTAAFFGADGIVIPKDRSAQVTPTAERVAAGGAATVPVVMVPNLARAMGELKDCGFWIYGTVGQGGVGLEDVRLEGKTALVLGAEGAGIRRLTRERCDALMTLPASSVVPALNVSVFAGVIVYEVMRQRTASKPANEGRSIESENEI